MGFLMEHEKLSYPEALKYLAAKYNIEIREKEMSEEESQRQNDRESMSVLNAFALKFFRNCLMETEEGRAVGLSYFRERGYRDDVLEKFRLGYSPEARDALTRTAQKQGYKLEFLVKTGLTIQKDEACFDRFRARVIFPFHSLSGTILGFGGRTLKSGGPMAKYINSPESELYHKSNVLYGLFLGKKEIVRQEKCYLVEGYTDVIALHQIGIENVVASSGTSLTPQQVRMIKRFAPNVTIIYDGDEAGIKASLRGIDIILEEGLNIKVVLLPEGEDPDSYAKKASASGFREFIEKNEKDFITFKASLLMEESGKDPVKRAGLINDIVRSISVIPDTITRSVYIKECSRLLDTDEKILYNQVYKHRRKRAEQKYRKEFQTGEVRITSGPVPGFISEIYSESQERFLVRFLLQFGNEKLFDVQDHSGQEHISVAEYIINEILNDDLEFRNLLYRKVFEEVQDMIREGGKIDTRHFVNHPQEDIARLAVDLLSTPYTLSAIHKKKGASVKTERMKLKENVPKAIVEYKRKILEMAQREKLDELRAALEKADPDDIIQDLQQQHMTISSMISAIANQWGWVVTKG